MKILHIDETFHPSYGYQAHPLAKFQQAQGHEVFIATVEKKWLYPVFKAFRDNGSGLEEADARFEQETGVKIYRAKAKGYVLGRLIYTKDIFDIVEQIHPDVIFVHCIETLTAIRFMYHPKMRKYPMLFDSHMLPMASRNRFANIYEWCFRQTVTRTVHKRNYTVIRTQDDDYVNSHLGISESLTPFISFGTDTMLFHPDEAVKAAFRQEHNIPEDAFVVVYTGKLSGSKGGKILAQATMEKFPFPFALILVGSPPPTQYGEEVTEMFNLSENQIVRFKTQNYLDLGKFYQAADLSVFPKQCSMSFYDAQACGLPVLSEDNNINVDRCRHGNGFNFKAGDAADFRAQIIRIAQMDSAQRQALSDNALAFIQDGNYSYNHIARQYTDYLQQAIDQHNSSGKTASRQ